MSTPEEEPPANTITEAPATAEAAEEGTTASAVVASATAAAAATATTKPSVIMVTGGSGLVGSAIKDYVEQQQQQQQNEGGNTRTTNDERWIFLSSKDGDLRDKNATVQIFEKYKPTHVIHLAARVGGLFANSAYKVEFFRENILINDNVMECCRIYGITKLVSFLSTCIFPDKNTIYPIDESMLHNGPPHPSNEGYAYAKRLIDTMNRAYAEEYGCNYTSIIPTNIYGPHDNYNVEAGHVIPGLIHKCYIAKQTNTPFVIYGSGKPLRQFIYSSDLAELAVWVLRHYNYDPNPITLSVDECDEVSIADIAYIIAKTFDYTGEIIFDTTKADGQYKKTATNQKLRTYLPDYKFTTIQDGIEKSVHWFIQNYDTCRK